MKALAGRCVCTRIPCRVRIETVRIEPKMVCAKPQWSYKIRMFRDAAFLWTARAVTGAQAGQKTPGPLGSRWVAAKAVQKKNFCAVCCTRLPCRVRIETSILLLHARSSICCTRLPCRVRIETQRASSRSSASRCCTRLPCRVRIETPGQS